MSDQAEITLLRIKAKTAEDLMSSNLISLRDDATLPEAVEFFAEHGFGAAVIIDEAGHPKGVLSKSDLLSHVRHAAEALSRGTPVIGPESVEQIMTRAIFRTPIDTPIRSVVDQLVTLHVHHLYVVDRSGLLVGVITPLDVMAQVDGEATDTDPIRE